MSFKCRVCITATAIAVSSAGAQQQMAAVRTANGAVAEPPAPSATVAVASRAAKAPIIDGKTDDAIWATAHVFSDFRTFDPDENGEPRFRTEARVAYDDHNLYVLVRALDPHCSAVATYARNQSGSS